jgi:hypothetical protein
MSINKIELSEAIIAELYSNKLIADAEIRKISLKIAILLLQYLIRRMKTKIISSFWAITVSKY